MKDRQTIALLLVLICLFLLPLITLQGRLLRGDNFLQFYPWYKVYSESIKQFSFPFWTPYMQSGFPLMAEGQIGGFYPLNILLFFFLPLAIAFNYSFVLHALLGGLFAYIYMRRLKILPLGALLGSLIFCFGSTQAGGFYNIITLKTLCWFPLVLYLLDTYSETNKRRYLFFGAVVFGMQLLAGFIQMALYAGMFYGIYYYVRSRQKKEKLRRFLLDTVLFYAIGLLIAAPQLYLTLRFIPLSVRAHDVSLGFALWGSFTPLGIFKFILPFANGFARGQAYITITGFVLALIGIVCVRRRNLPQLLPIIVIAVISFLCALGKYNPLYVLIIKVTKLYGLRNPSKFLFFSLFSLSVCAGSALSLIGSLDDKLRQAVRTIALRVMLLLLAAVFLLKIILLTGRDFIMRLGRWGIEHFVVGKSYHRHSLDSYIAKMERIYNEMAQSLSFTNGFFIYSLGAIVVALALLAWYCRRHLEPKAARWMRTVILVVVFSELVIYHISPRGFTAQLTGTRPLKPDQENLFQHLKKEEEPFRIYPFNLSSWELPNWAMANANIIYGVESIASYTPLSGFSYWQRMKELGVIDDSLGYFSSRQDALKEEAALLRLLNVKYVVSAEPILSRQLALVEREDNIFLYELRGYYPRFFFSSSLKDIAPVEPRRIKVITYRPQTLEVEVEAPEEGYFIFSQWHHPSWRAFVDGKEASIVTVEGVVCAVLLTKGTHTVQFSFYPHAAYK